MGFLYQNIRLNPVFLKWHLYPSKPLEEKNARVLGCIFKMAPLLLKTLIGEKEC
jgi:hypothetical protein